jgi:hypothetical protein
MVCCLFWESNKEKILTLFCFRDNANLDGASQGEMDDEIEMNVQFAQTDLLLAQNGT